MGSRLVLENSCKRWQLGGAQLVPLDYTERKEVVSELGMGSAWGSNGLGVDPCTIWIAVPVVSGEQYPALALLLRLHGQSHRPNE